MARLAPCSLSVFKLNLCVLNTWGRRGRWLVGSYPFEMRRQAVQIYLEKGFPSRFASEDSLSTNARSNFVPGLNAPIRFGEVENWIGNRRHR